MTHVKATMNPAVPAVYALRVVEPAKVETINLEMSRDVAETLLITARHIGGHPDGRRGHFDSIQAALLDAGVRVSHLTAPRGLDAFPSTHHHFAKGPYSTLHFRDFI